MRRLDFYRLWDIKIMCQTLHGVGYTQCSITSQWVRSTRCRKMKLICLITHIFERPRLTYVWFLGTLHSSVLFWNIGLMSTLFLSKIIMQNKKYVLSNSESVHCNCFIFDHVTFSSKSAAVYKISWKPDDFSLRYGDISIFKMAAVRHLRIVLPPTTQDHPQSLCCWPQLHVKCHVNLIHRSEDIAIWIFRIFGLKCLFRPKIEGFGGTAYRGSVPILRI